MEDGKTGFGKKIAALANLIRLPNLIIIVLTQVLLRYCILEPFVYSNDTEVMSALSDFILLCLTTVLITSGGYVINDYFDIKIDEVNKPAHMVVGTYIRRRTAIKWHILLSSLGSLLGFYLAWKIRLISFGLIFPVISFLLFWYSVKYKRKLVWGNLIVAVLSAMVVIIVFLYEFFWIRLHPEFFTDMLPDLFWVSRIFTAYATFAFLVTFFREVIKDMEDVKGDSAVGCKTLPIICGMQAARYLVSSLIFLTILLLGFGLTVLYRLGLMVPFWYLLITTQMPMIYLIYRVFSSNTPQEYHIMSNICKLVMVAGVLSMEIIAISI